MFKQIKLKSFQSLMKNSVLMILILSCLISCGKTSSNDVLAGDTDSTDTDTQTGEEIPDITDYEPNYLQRVVGEKFNVATAFNFSPSSFISSDINIATVDASGNVAILAAGSVEITAIETTPEVATKALASNMSFKNASALTIANGNSLQFSIIDRIMGVAAWVGAEDTEVNFGTAAQGVTLISTTSSNCNYVNYFSCDNATATNVGTENFIDQALTLDQAGYYGYFFGNNLAGHSLVSTEKFDARSGYRVVSFKGAMILVGGRDNNSFEYYNDIWISVDGDTWVQVVEETPFSMYANMAIVQWNDKLWLSGGSKENGLSAEVWSSVDGINWTQETENSGFNPRDDHFMYVANNTLFVSSGYGFDGIDHYLLNDLWSSTDGINWSQRSNDFLTLESAGDHTYEYFNGTHWFFGDTSFKSDDGLNWEAFTPTETLIGDEFFSINYNNELWLYGYTIDGLNGNIRFYRSSDGLTWEAPHGGVLLGNLVPMVSQAVNHNDRVYFVGGRIGAITRTNEVWSTTDGFVWNEHDIGGFYGKRISHAVTEHNGSLWSVGGKSYNGFDFANPFSADVWKSDDGLQWNLATDTPEFKGLAGHSLLSFNDSLWVLGGYGRVGTISILMGNLISSFLSVTDTANNDIWTSSDGETWSAVEAINPFSARRDMAAIVFNERMWVIGGTDTNNFYSDIWSSADGTNWLRHTTSAEFSKRAGHAIVEHNGELIMTGGIQANGDYLDDVWKSTDGIVWTQVKAHFHDYVQDDAYYTLKDSNDVEIKWWGDETDLYMRQRAYHQMVSFNDKLWVIGGRINNHPSVTRDTSGTGFSTIYLGNDIWMSEDSGVTWQLVLSSSYNESYPLADTSPFSPRQDHRAYVFNNAIHMSGGLGDDGLYTIATKDSYLNDVWRSENGKNWRSGITSEVFLNQYE